MKKFVIFDSHAVIHRAYHAMPPLTSRNGLAVNAVYGFTTILLKVLNELKPDYVACAFDLPMPTFRHIEYKEYKATRQKAPDDLIPQFDLVRQVLESMNIPCFSKEGYEADDIIGSLSRQIDHDMETIIVTGDLDELQLVNKSTKIYTMQRGFTDTIIYDIEKVKERYGLTPAEFIEYKALKGDASDNIPGVPGIGEKTAIALIQSYGNLEGVYDHLEDLKPAAKRNLEENKDKAFLSRRLGTIVTDMKLDLDFEQARTHDFDREKVQDLFRELGFKSLYDKLPPKPGMSGDGEEVSEKQAVNGKYNIISTVQELDKLIAEIKKVGLVSVDTETTSLNAIKADLVGFCLAVKEGEGYYIPVGHVKGIRNNELRITPPERTFSVRAGNQIQNKNNKNDLFEKSKENAEPSQFDLFDNEAKIEVRGLAEGQLDFDLVNQKLKPILEADNIQKIGHNIKYDYKVIEKYGIKINPISYDTMIAAYLLDPNARPQKLDDLAFNELGVKMIPITQLIGKGKDQILFCDTTIEDACSYAAEDADITLRLFHFYEPKLKERGLGELFKKMEMPIVKILAEMEVNGILIDSDFLNNISAKFTKKIKELEGEIWKISGDEFNISSPVQLKEILFDKLKLAENPEIRKSLKRVKSGGFSTAAGELEKIRGLHPIVNLISEYREITKLKSTYVDSLPLLVNERTGRVHTSYNQAVTATGRLSSSDPNLQNIPIRTELGNEIRKAFIAKKGYKLLAADYSQIELRMVAHISNDAKMIEAFSSREDIHRRTAALVFGVNDAEVTADMRRIAKVVNFGVLYGMSPHGLSQATGMDRTKAKEFIDKYFEVHQGIAKYIEETKISALKNRYVETPFGRRRYIPEIDSTNFMVRAGAERMAVNMPVQGGAADIMKMAMIGIGARISDVSIRTRMLLQVHDELIFEVPETEVEKVAIFVKQEMEKVVSLKVPIEVKIEVGDNWGEMTELEL